MTAVIYARYSSVNQREESIEGQIRECTAYAEKNGITIVKHYIDPPLWSYCETVTRQKSAQYSNSIFAICNPTL